MRKALALVLGIILVWLTFNKIDFQFSSIDERFFSFWIVSGWLALTVIIRLLMVETLVWPVNALGFSIGRLDAFWLGWLRSFFNQLFPFLGTGLLATYFRRWSGMNWGYVSALAVPQFILATCVAFGILALTTILKIGQLQEVGVVILLFSIASCIVLWLLGVGVIDIFSCLPGRVAEKFAVLQGGLLIVSTNYRLMAVLVGCYFLSFVLRGIRLMLLFWGAINYNIDLSDLVFILALSEFGFLVQLTPGGIGIREGVMVSAAWMLDLDLELVFLAALADRIYTVISLVVMFVPSYFSLAHSHGVGRKS